MATGPENPATAPLYMFPNSDIYYTGIAPCYREGAHTMLAGIAGKSYIVFWMAEVTLAIMLNF